MTQPGYTPPFQNTLPNRPLVLSIPHSGTRSLLTCIHGEGWDDWTKNRTEQAMFMHVANRNHRKFPGISQERFIITPLREPRSMWNSWVKRIDGDRMELGIKKGAMPYGVRPGPGPKLYTNRWPEAAELGMRPLDMFEDQWRDLECYDREYEIFYIPIDTHCTHQKIQQLSSIVEKELVFDKSKKIGHIKKTKVTDHPGPDWEYIYNLPFIKEFYPWRDDESSNTR